MFVLGSQSVLMSQLDKLKILILDVEGVLVMLRQLMEDPVLKSNLLVPNFIFVNAFAQLEVILPLFKDAALHG